MNLADDVDRSSRAGRDWLDEAVRPVEADANRSADTPYCEQVEAALR